MSVRFPLKELLVVPTDVVDFFSMIADTVSQLRYEAYLIFVDDKNILPNNTRYYLDNKNSLYSKYNGKLLAITKKLPTYFASKPSKDVSISLDEWFALTFKPIFQLSQAKDLNGKYIYCICDDSDYDACYFSYFINSGNTKDIRYKHVGSVFVKDDLKKLLSCSSCVKNVEASCEIKSYVDYIVKLLIDNGNGEFYKNVNFTANELLKIKNKVNDLKKWS